MPTAFPSVFGSRKGCLTLVSRSFPLFLNALLQFPRPLARVSALKTVQVQSELGRADETQTARGPVVL